jgi:hypothetical protein
MTEQKKKSYTPEFKKGNRSGIEVGPDKPIEFSFLS